MKKIEIEIPDGKRAEWINGVLTLVDEPKEGDRPVTERIKTFEDACEELGCEHQYVKEYRECMRTGLYECKAVMAYLKLRIITAALNEGWVPTFGEDECRYYPWFYIYAKEKYEKLDKGDKRFSRVPLRSYSNASAVGGLVFAGAGVAGSNSFSNYGVRLALKTEGPAEYCGKQFIDIWADFLFA